jgi:hypothetical protein
MELDNNDHYDLQVKACKSTISMPSRVSYSIAFPVDLDHFIPNSGIPGEF